MFTRNFGLAVTTYLALVVGGHRSQLLNQPRGDSSVIRPLIVFWRQHT